MSSYDEAMKAEQNIKHLFIQRAPATVAIVRMAQTYASTVSRAKSVANVR